MFKAFMTKHFGGVPSFKSLKWLIRINPESSNSLPLASEYRKTAPGSQKQPNLDFELPIAKNRYYERDTRRNHPQAVVFTKSQLSELPLLGTAPVKNERVVLDFRYKYRAGKTDHDPTGSAANPQFCIRTVQ